MLNQTTTKNSVSIWIVLILLVAAVPDVEAAQGTGDLAITNAVVIDGTGAEPVEGATVVVRDGKIESVSRDGSVPEGVRLIDLEGRYLLPGLIDAHVHIASPAQARAALVSGVTTARSMGAANFADAGLRDLGENGYLDGPDILAAGYHVRPTVDPNFFINEPSLGDLMGPNKVRGAANIRRVVSKLLEHDVDFIKMVATDRAGLPDTNPRRQIFTQEEIAAAVETASERGIPVAVHAHGDGGAQAAVRAGVRSIEHGTFISDETIGLMSRNGTFLVPTIAIVTDLMHPGGDYDSPTLQIRGRFMYERLLANALKAHEAGVKVVAATDTGYSPGSVVRMQHEVEELVRAGLPPMVAIQSATTTAAELLGIEERTGSIRAGMEADLIVVDQNPLDNIIALQDVVIVITDGRVAINHLETSPD